MPKSEYDYPEWMSRMFGHDRDSLSMRCRIASYVYSHLPERCDVDVVAKVLDYSEQQVRSEFSRIIRRNKRYELPYKCEWDTTKQSISLIPV